VILFSGSLSISYCPEGVGELSPRFQPVKVRRDALLTAESLNAVLLKFHCCRDFGRIGVLKSAKLEAHTLFQSLRNGNRAGWHE
jgi:hypothetical protein